MLNQQQKQELEEMRKTSHLYEQYTGKNTQQQDEDAFMYWLFKYYDEAYNAEEIFQKGNCTKEQLAWIAKARNDLNKYVKANKSYMKWLNEKQEKRNEIRKIVYEVFMDIYTEWNKKIEENNIIKI